MDMLTPAPSTTPNEIHRRMIERKYGMFIHFGINTYNEVEWSDGTLPAASYHPTALDTDDWARTAKEAGMRYVILITKHHDGFCLWDSPETDYSIANSPVTTDVIARMAASCQKFDIELGLYYSLWDRNWGDGIMRRSTFDRDLEVPEDQMQAYVDYMDRQIAEIMSNYGPICELWLDGSWVLPREAWQVPRIYTTVRKRQPHCALSVNWTIGRPDEVDTHGVFPEDQKEGFPIRYFPSDFRLGDPWLPGDNDPKLFSHEDELYYMPFESTVCLNDKKWFYNSETDTTHKSLEELVALYKRATAQDNILILNSPPNREGRMPESNAKLLRELAAQVGLEV